MNIPTYKIVSRHSANCKHSDRTVIDCNCKKHIAIYDPRQPQIGKQEVRYGDQTVTIINRQGSFPAKTRSYRDAEIIAQAYRDLHDPNVKARLEAEEKLAAKEAKEQSQTVSIRKAIAMFYASKKTSGTSLNRIKRYYPLLGNIDSNLQFVCTRRRGTNGKGKLFEFLETLKPVPVNVADLTNALVEEFHNTWGYPSDQTHRQEFSNLKEFFRYCVTKRWIDRNPMEGMKTPRVQEGSRTTAFSGPQYDAILAVINSRTGEDAQRLLAFVELMRWGGLALEDAVRFELSSMKNDGRVSYPRIKTFRRTGRKATPQLLPHVVPLLRSVVPIDGDLNRPFWDKAVAMSTNKNRWSTLVKEICSEAGIDVVKTDIRDREPHAHMFRDTFAVSRLIKQYEMNQVDHKLIADELGDTEAVFVKHYAPQIDELKKARQDARQRIVDAQAADWAAKHKQDKVTNIAGGRR